jgi:hypothetical protein
LGYTGWHSRLETVLHFGYPQDCYVGGHSYQKDAPDAMYDDLTLSFTCSAPDSPGQPFSFGGTCTIQGVWDNCLPRCDVARIASGNDVGYTLFGTSGNGRITGNKCTTGGKYVGKFFWSGRGGANGYVTIG